MQIPRVKNLPENIRESFQYMAHYLLGEMQQNWLDVILVDAPEQRHCGHKVRLAVNSNPQWWSEMYNSHPVKLDRKCFLDALKRIMESKDLDCKYDCMAREKIKDFLCEGLYGEFLEPQVLEYFKQFENKAHL